MEESGSAKVLEVYIVGPGDTLAGIALSRDTTIREIKALNKLWSDTIWPGQKLRVPKRREKTERDSGGTQKKAASMDEKIGSKPSSSNSGDNILQTQSHLLQSTQLPLLVRLRNLFDNHDTPYYQVVQRPIRLTVNNGRTARLRSASLLSKAVAEGSSEEKDVISVRAIYLRLRPFLAVNGQMTLTTTRLIFLPDLYDPHVRKLGSTSLQVDVPTTNVENVRRAKPSDLDLLIEQDVGLELQEDQRFLEVVYRADSPNNVVPTEAVRGGIRGKRQSSSNASSSFSVSASLYFMLLPQALVDVRARLLQLIGELGPTGAASLPVLVCPKNYENCLVGKSDLLQLQSNVIPPLFRGNEKWYLRFSTRVDGISMTTLMNRVADVSPLILLLQTTGSSECFGVYIGDELEYHREYYGSDRTVLFRLSPEFACWGASGVNSYYLLVDERGLSFGLDSEGRVALFIDNEISFGETQACLTFNNTPLISSSSSHNNNNNNSNNNSSNNNNSSKESLKFTIKCLEIYAFEEVGK